MTNIKHFFWEISQLFVFIVYDTINQMTEIEGWRLGVHF